VPPMDRVAVGRPTGQRRAAGERKWSQLDWRRVERPKEGRQRGARWRQQQPLETGVCERPGAAPRAVQ